MFGNGFAVEINAFLMRVEPALKVCPKRSNVLSSDDQVVHACEFDDTHTTKRSRRSGELPATRQQSLQPELSPLEASRVRGSFHRS